MVSPKGIRTVVLTDGTRGEQNSPIAAQWHDVRMQNPLLTETLVAVHCWITFC